MGKLTFTLSILLGLFMVYDLNRNVFPKDTMVYKDANSASNSYQIKSGTTRHAGVYPFL